MEHICAGGRSGSTWDRWEAEGGQEAGSHGGDPHGQSLCRTAVHSAE